MAVQRLLDKLKLEEYQALCVLHTDADHAHIHVIANPVHPDHGEIGSDGWRRMSGQHTIHVGHEMPEKERD